MKLPFVLGMEVLCRVHAQLDLKACMLTLCGNDGSVIGLYKQMKVLSLAVLAQIQVLDT